MSSSHDSESHSLEQLQEENAQLRECLAAFQNEEAGARFRKVFEEGPVGIIISDLTLRIQHANPRVCEMLGFTEAELQQRTVRDITYPEDWEKSREYADKLSAGSPTPNIFEKRYVTRTGLNLWSRISISLMHGADGKPQYYLGVIEDITEWKRQEEWQQAQNRLLEKMVSDATLSEILNELVLIIEAQASGMLGSVLLLDETGKYLRSGASPNLPEEYSRIIESYEIGPGAGSCGTAAYRAEPVVVEDINQDPLWTDFREIALGFQLRACWSYPILNRNGSVLGTFALYYHTPRAPKDFERKLIEDAIYLARIAIEQAQNDRRLRDSQSYNEAILSAVPDLLFVMSAEGDYLDCHAQSEAELLVPREAFIGKNVQETLPDPLARMVLEKIQETLQTHRPQSLEYSLNLQNHLQWFDARIARMGSNRVLVLVRNITERKALQTQLFEAQKMESLGRMAGGIAHDFNNLLMVILGTLELAEEEMPPDIWEQAQLENVRAAANRAAGLTRQLLAYARRQIVEFSSIDINKLITDMDTLLRRTLGAQYELVTLLAEEECHANASTTQMEQVLLNLIVNARDAMSEGGPIRLQTRCVSLTSEYAASYIGVQPGEYVVFSVSDEGSGMPPEVLEHIFEPFYTTKEVGKGTGLGLATCYGIVKQCGGNIRVNSMVGKGTTFEVYLPRMEERAPIESAVGQEALAQGKATILVVDDEPMVRDIVAQTLRKRGYEVLEASSGMEAEQRIRERPGVIDLLLTDLVMPLMSGKELAERLRKHQPNLKVLFMSGYTQGIDAVPVGAEADMMLIMKPFTARPLLQKVKEILAGG